MIIMKEYLIEVTEENSNKKRDKCTIISWGQREDFSCSSLFEQTQSVVAFNEKNEKENDLKVDSGTKKSHHNWLAPLVLSIAGYVFHY